MTRRMRFLRLFGPIAMAVQLVLPPALTLADAVLERDSGSATVAHVEDHSHSGCRLPHTDNCAICRTLSNLSAPRPTAPRIDIARRGNAIGVETVLPAVCTDAWYGPPPSRAPPA